MTRKKKVGDAKERRGWTTDEQYTYLSSYIPTYAAAQSSKSTGDIWPALFEEWFRRWPLGPPTEEDIKAKKSEDDRIKAKKQVSAKFRYYYIRLHLHLFDREFANGLTTMCATPLLEL